MFYLCVLKTENKYLEGSWSSDKKKLMKSTKTTSRVVSKEIIYTPYTASELHAAAFVAVILSN
jgi:hypothetical protein